MTDNSLIFPSNVRPYQRRAESKGIPFTAGPVGESASAQWPTPIGDTARLGLADDFLGLVAPQSEADANALLLQLLTGFGSAVGHGPFFRTERDRQTCNLFTVIIGETAGGRKGTGFDHVRDIIVRADPTWKDASGMASGEGLIHHVRDPVTARDPKSGELRVVDEGVLDKRLFCYEPEFAQVLKVAAREGNTLSPVLRRSWEHGDLQTMTRNSPLRATGAHIAAVCHVTTDELVRLLTLTETASGFANRFAYCLSRRSRILPEGGNVDQGALEQLAQQTRSLLIRAQDVQEMQRDDQARALWAREYERLTSPPAGLLGCMVARAAPIVVRLSAIYALTDAGNSKPQVIAADHLAAALEVWRYLDTSCRFVFKDKLGDETADTILVGLRAAAPDGLARTEISGLLGRHASAADINRAMGMIAMRGLAVKFMEQTGGRPTERWKAAK